MLPERKKPNLLHRLLLFIANAFPWARLGSFLNLVPLALYRVVLQRVNLYPVPLAPNPTLTNIPNHRTANATGNDPKHYYAGAVNTPFGRNMPPAQHSNPAADPPVQLVAARLLHRTSFKPAAMQLNVLAAAWIQAMAHDWFGHADSDDTVVLDRATPQCPLQTFRFKATKRRPDGFFDNVRTHWWDASFLYGQNDRAVNRARTGRDGKLHVSDVKGRLLRDPVTGTNLVSDAFNSWVGVALLQDLFAREHNMVCDAVAEAHPAFARDDERLFRIARLVISAIVAKIHTVDWTVELLKTETLRLAMNGNWFGLQRTLGLTNNGPPGFLGLVASNETENHGVPFCLTEEFVAVYRLHPLLPDGLPLESGFQPLEKLVGLAGEDILHSSESIPRQVWDALIKYPCGNLELFNYPHALRNLAPTNTAGEALPDHVDLAALDLYRDRERGIRKYNDFRRELHLKPFASYEDLCENSDTANIMKELYGKNGIENVDLLVGLLAEKKISGFAISETAFFIFVLMASRRLEADRFLTTDFNETTYTKRGFQWVSETSGMRDVLRRHFPEIEANIKHGISAFTPQKPWPKPNERVET